MKKTRITNDPMLNKLKREYPFIKFLVYKLDKPYDKPPYNGRSYYVKFYISLYDYYTNKHKQKGKIKRLPKDIENWNNYEVVVYGSNLDDLFEKIKYSFLIYCIEPFPQEEQ